LDCAADKIIEKRKALWQSFYDVTSEQRLMYIVEFCDRDVGGAWPNRDKQKERIDWSLKLYEYEMEQTLWLNDHKIPFLRNTTGTEIFAEAFGCKVRYRDDNMPSAIPLVNNSKEAARIKMPSIYDGALSQIFEIADTVKEKAGKNALMGLPDIQSPMDIAALIWDKNDFFAAMYYDPQAVKELEKMTCQLLIDFLDEWFKLYGSEFIAHFPRYHMYKGISVSEDEIGSVSTDMFNEFFLEGLNELSDRYGGIGIHCCANARHQWDNLKQIKNLKLLNLYIKAEETFEFFENRTALWSGWCGEGEPFMWDGQIKAKNAHKVICVTAESKEQAIKWVEAAQK